MEIYFSNLLFLMKLNEIEQDNLKHLNFLQKVFSISIEKKINTFLMCKI